MVLWLFLSKVGASLISQLVKNLPAMHETLVRFLGWEDALEKGMATHSVFLGFPVAQLVKNPPTMRETWVGSLDWEDPLEKGKAATPVLEYWRIPWTVWSMESQRVGHN